LRERWRCQSAAVANELSERVATMTACSLSEVEDERTGAAPRSAGATDVAIGPGAAVQAERIVAKGPIETVFGAVLRAYAPRRSNEYSAFRQLIISDHRVLARAESVRWPA